MKFYLKKLPTGRVYLSQIEPVKGEVVLKEVDADAWIYARSQIYKIEQSLGIAHDYGYGYIG